MASSVPSYLNSLILHGVNLTGREIGRGAYGRVFEVDYEGTLCAAKEVHALLLQYAQGGDLQKIKDDFLSECQIWSTLRHPCVVQFLGVYYPAMDQYRLPVMVMEKMQHSLKGLVENYDNIPLNVKLSILDEVCLGLRYLHSRNPPIIHRDLTPNNILLGRCLEAKITDLGVAKVMQTSDAKTMTKAPGTTDFMPPECLADRPIYGVSLDVFSYGGAILYTITQLWPQPSSWVQFDPDTGGSIYLSELQRRQRYLDKMTRGAVDLKPLVMSCLDNNPKKRPPLTQVSMTIKRAKNDCSQKSSHDGMSPIVWWAEVTSGQQSQQLLLKESTTPGDLFSTPVNIKWEEGAPAPVGRYGHTAVWLNGLVYVGGGYESGSSYTINCYDPINNSWSSSINTPYCFFTMATLNNKLVTAGGKDRSGRTNQVLTLDAGLLKNYTTDMITARSHATAAGYQGILIIIGGKDDKGKIFSSTELFNSNNGQWYESSDLPQPHSSLKSVIVDDVLYLLGGFNKDSISSPTVFTAPLVALSSHVHWLNWNAHQMQDTPWRYFAPVSVNGTHVLIIGGYKSTGGNATVTSDIHKLNKVSHSWEAIGHIPFARSSSAAVNTAVNRVIVIGGVNDKREETNTVWIGTMVTELASHFS